MNAVMQHRDEVGVGNVGATEAKIDALRDTLDETKQDVRELRGEIHSLRDKVDRNHGEMHAGFAALRKTMDDMGATLRSDMAAVQQSVAGLRATLRTVLWGVTAVGMLAMIFFAAGKALHWF
jgi:polyhydroxyalkanoate synthesis regulator phasin